MSQQGSLLHGTMHELYLAYIRREAAASRSLVYTKANTIIPPLATGKCKYVWWYVSSYHSFSVECLGYNIRRRLKSYLHHLGVNPPPLPVIVNVVV